MVSGFSRDTLLTNYEGDYKKKTERGRVLRNKRKDQLSEIGVSGYMTETL